MYSSILGPLWNNNPPVVNTIPPTMYATSDNDSMHQNLVLNLNYSPTQIKTAAQTASDKIFSNLPIKEWQEKSSTFFHEKRYFIGASIILGGYVLACHYFVQGNKYLERTDTWAAWHSETPLDLLVSYPQLDLAKELILEIQRRYSNAKNPTDFISPLITFVKTIDEEIATVKQYSEVYRWAKQCYLHTIFPINQKQFNLLEEKHKKLVYLKNIFLSWAAEYKINHNKRTRSIPAYK